MSAANDSAPDASAATTSDELDRAVASLKELFDSRLTAIHKDLDAFRSGHEEKHVSVVSAAIQHRKEISDALTSALRNATEIQFKGVQDQFLETDRRYQERYEAQNLALSAALDAKQKAVEAALVAQQRETLAMVGEVKDQMAAQEKLADAKFAAVRESIRDEAEKVQVALTSSERAVSKVAEANEKRFDSVNEFRGQLTDQAHTFIPRAEAETRLAALAEKVEDLKGYALTTQGRDSVTPTIETRIGEIANQVSALATQAATLQGRDSGSQMDRRFDELTKSVDQLRLNQTQQTGQSEGRQLSMGFIVTGVGLVATILSIVIILANVLT